MIEFLILWHSLPIVVKAFTIIVSFYLYVIVCIHIYARYETYSYHYQNRHTQSLEDKYKDIIDKGLLEIIDNSSTQDVQFIDVLKRMKSNKALRVLFYKRCLHVLNISEVDEARKCNMKYLYRFLEEKQLYKKVISDEKRIGVYNMLIVLARFHDQNAMSIFEKYEKIFFKQQNIYLAYLVMLGYSQLHKMDDLRRVFDKVVSNREISNEKLYINILLTCEESVLDWQEDSLLNGSIGLKVVALAYFIKIVRGDYLDVCKKYLSELLQKDMLDDRERDYAILLVKYCSMFDRKDFNNLSNQISLNKNNQWKAILSELDKTDGVINYGYN